MTCQVKFINKKKFAEVLLDENIEVFVAYISILATNMIICLGKKALIFSLFVKKIIIIAEYLIMQMFSQNNL